MKQAAQLGQELFPCAAEQRLHAPGRRVRFSLNDGGDPYEYKSVRPGRAMRSRGTRSPNRRRGERSRHNAQCMGVHSAHSSTELRALFPVRNCPPVKRLSLALLFLAAPVFALGEDVPLPAKIDFNRDVRPILSENCFKCHGFDPKTREADRRLDTREGALAENDGFRAIVPGKLAESEMHLRIHAKDEDEKMPPSDSRKALSPRQIAILDKWIEQGADYQTHWAYLAPTRRGVAAASQGEHPVDALVHARLAELGLKPSPEADRVTLARRLSFDLTGLPPAPADVAAFVADTSANAVEKLADRLIASPQFGERMAMPWLDVVRYADSMGYHSDNPRNVYPYRDYVIRAFNENKPFDKFTVEQIAGDLLPVSTVEHKVASGFNRLLLTTEEGGAQAKDYEQRMLTDRVRAIGTVWLAQTTGCAQCHDHKFDPITARDFYQLGAFFADIKEPIIGKPEPGMPVLDAAGQQKLDALIAQVTALQKEFDAPRPELAAAQTEWEQQALTSGDKAAWTPLHAEKVASEAGSQLAVEAGGIIRASNVPEGKLDAYRIEAKAAPGVITGFRLEALKSSRLPAQGPGNAGNGNFVLGEIIIEANGKPVKFAQATATFEQGAFPAKNAIDGKGDQKLNGWGVLGGTGADQSLYLELSEPLTTTAEAPLVFTLRFPYSEKHTLGKFRLNATTSPKPVRAPGADVPKEIADILKVAPEQRTPPQKEKLAAHFRSVAPQLAEVRGKLEAAKKAQKDFEDLAPRTLVSIHMDTPRTVRILPRGDWMDESGEVVQPALPHYLPQPTFEPGRKLTRLDLAQWLVARENPLTARVFVNRLWKHFFGTGISKVLDDLGAQGEPPINPALLDWLAVEFMDSGWSVKHMVKLMVTSQTYRQSSRASKELLARDPLNREAARQSPFRLDAELVRDNALTIAGLLNPKIGGPSVFPYQPAGYWENLNFPTREWQPSTDANQWRRGLYTHWQRSYLHPSMLAFDAPSREECVAERVRSNIPQQALALLNDPTYVEAARAFAARMIKEGGADATQRITWAFRQALTRDPRPDELETLTALVAKHSAVFTAAADAPAQLLKVGLAPAPAEPSAAELAAWTSVARVILNLHETITRS